MEAIFDLTLQEGTILRFLNLLIIQSPAGISIYQTDHIVETILELYFKDRDTSALISITSPFPTDSSFEKCLHEAPILVCTTLCDVETKYGGSLFHWNDVLLHVALTTRLDIGYAIMQIYGYLTTPNTVIFEGMEHTMRYLYFSDICHLCIRAARSTNVLWLCIGEKSQQNNFLQNMARYW
jgi:hypothetical protein